MYEQFYGFHKTPFGNTSDSRVFFESDSHQEAYAALEYGVMQRKGIILLTGEVGTGKTTICKRFIDCLDQKIKTSLILNPYFSDIQLLQLIVEDFGIQTEKTSRRDLVKILNDFLMRVHAQGGNAVLIIDEAQNLTTRQLEQIRLLSNLETPDQKLLQLVLVGQPELLEHLSKHKLRQIRQRIFVKYAMMPLKPEEIQKYLQVRFSDAGRNDIELPISVCDLIYEFSKGVPRLINMLCDRAFLIGYTRDMQTLNDVIFKEAMKEMI